MIFSALYIFFKFSTRKSLKVKPATVKSLDWDPRETWTLGYLEAEKSEEGAGGDNALEQAAQGRVDGEGGVHAHQARHDAPTCLQQIQCCGSGMFIPDAGSELFLPRIPDPNFFHPGSRIPDPNFFHPGSEFFHPGSRIPDPDYNGKPDPDSISMKKQDPVSGTAFNSKFSKFSGSKWFMKFQRKFFSMRNAYYTRRGKRLIQQSKIKANFLSFLHC